MKRREVLKTAGLIMGYTFTAGTVAAVMGGCSADPVPGWTPEVLDIDHVNTINSLTDAIFHGGGFPSSDEIMIGKYMDEKLKIYSSEEDIEKYKESFKGFDDRIKSEYGKAFSKLPIEKQVEAVRKGLDDEDGFTKQMYGEIIAGLCTSEAGAKKVLVYDPIPGEQKGCIPFEEVNGIWAI